MSGMHRMGRWLPFVAAVLLASLAYAGLMATWITDMEQLVAVPVNDALVFLLVVVIGALLGLVLEDLGQSATALVLSSVLGATLFGLALAAPGFTVEGFRVQLIDRGTTYGLGALLIFVLFGLIGLVVSWLVQAYAFRERM